MPTAAMLPVTRVCTTCARDAGAASTPVTAVNAVAKASTPTPPPTSRVGSTSHWTRRFGVSFTGQPCPGVGVSAVTWEYLRRMVR